MNSVNNLISAYLAELVSWKFVVDCRIRGYTIFHKTKVVLFRNLHVTSIFFIVYEVCMGYAFQRIARRTFYFSVNLYDKAHLCSFVKHS